MIGRDDMVKRIHEINNKGNMSHMMFAGPKGYGKMTAAILVAKTILGDSYESNCKIVYAADPLTKEERADVKKKSYVSTSKVGSAAGRSFSKTHLTDTSNYIINETAVKAMKLNSPIDNQLTLWEKTGTIIGVVKDYHFKSLHNPIEPLLLRLYEPQWLFFLFVRIKPENISNTVRFLESKWQKFSPDVPFRYSFIDQLLENQYSIQSLK